MKSKRFIPNDGEKYFDVYGNGEIVSTSYGTTGGNFDKFNVKIRNCFRTKEEAEDYKKFIDIESRLRDLADELEENSDNYLYLSYDGEVMKDIVGMWSTNIYPQISCKNSNFNTIAQERIGFDDLKFYLTYKR